MKTSLALCRKNGLVMQNQWLGIHRVKILYILILVFLTQRQNLSRVLQKYHKIPHDFFDRSAQSAKIFGIFRNKLSLGVRCPCHHLSKATTTTTHSDHARDQSLKSESGLSQAQGFRNQGIQRSFNQRMSHDVGPGLSIY